MFNFFKKKSMIEDIKNDDGSVTHVVTEQDHAEGKFTEVAIGDSATFMPTGPARLYEIQDKVTGEISPVEKLGSGDVDNDQDADFIVHKEDGTEVVFEREGSNDDGAIFVNEQFTVRDRETKLAPNGVTLVADVVPASNDSNAGEGAAAAEGEKVEFAVFKDGAFVRAYNKADHGEEAETLAKQYAEKIGGTVN